MIGLAQRTLHDAAQEGTVLAVVVFSFRQVETNKAFVNRFVTQVFAKRAFVHKQVPVQFVGFVKQRQQPRAVSLGQIFVKRGLEQFQWQVVCAWVQTVLTVHDANNRLGSFHFLTEKMNVTDAAEVALAKTQQGKPNEPTPLEEDPSMTYARMVDAVSSNLPGDLCVCARKPHCRCEDDCLCDDDEFFVLLRLRVEQHSNCKGLVEFTLRDEAKVPLNRNKIWRVFRLLPWDTQADDAEIPLFDITHDTLTFLQAPRTTFNMTERRMKGNSGQVSFNYLHAE